MRNEDGQFYIGRTWIIEQSQNFASVSRPPAASYLESNMFCDKLDGSNWRMEMSRAMVL
jgi:hypothetical protein